MDDALVRNALQDNEFMGPKTNFAQIIFQSIFLRMVVPVLNIEIKIGHSCFFLRPQTNT